VKNLPTRNVLYRWIWTADSYVSTALFETWDVLKRAGSAYSSFLYRWFRISGPKRILIDLIDDFFTFGVIAVFGLLAYALPPFSGTGDIWNRGREYAMTFTDSNGEIIGQRGIKQNDAIPLDEIPPAMINAVLATEDARFYDHFGVDVIGTLRAIIRNARANGVKQGGSSITQQVAKNLFLSPEKTIRRKVNEAFLSMWIEARLSKNEILKLYLDRSYLGGGNYGVEAASQFYFGKSVRDINLSESAVLAGLFKAPTNYAPHKNPEASKVRTNVVLFRMLDAGFINQGELLQARRAPAQIVQQTISQSPNWFLDWAYQDTLDVMDKQGLKGQFVVEVKTTIDHKLQDASQLILNDVVDHIGPEKNFSQASSITMSPDGAIRAIVGGREYEESQFNRAVSAQRQPGSSFKPFVYLTALLHGYTPESKVLDGPVSVGNWSPKNYEAGYAGNVTLTTALAHSYNSVPVRLMIDVGRPEIIKTAHLVGIQATLETWAPMVLGTSALTLIDLTTGYATFASGGKLARPYAVLEIHKPNGDLIYSRATNESDREQVVPEEKIAELNTMLKAVVDYGTATKARLGFEPQAGKTGTNQSYRDAWFIGFTAHHVTGVWVGNDDFTPMDRVTGGLVPAPTWKRIMDVADAGLTPESLPGIPMDSSFVAVENPEPDPALVSDVAAPTAPVVIAAGEKRAAETSATPLVSNAADEAQLSPDTNFITPDGVDAGSKSVLDGMFNLFENTPDAVPTQVQSKPISFVTRKPQHTLILPKANTSNKQKPNFFQRIFGNSGKRSKHKTIFGF
jgi:penicillin-binding protein 1A